MPAKGRISNAHPIPEKVIVELQLPDMDYQRDALLPSQMPISEIKVGLLRLLREREPKRFSKLGGISLSYCGKQLYDDATLASLGIWDGSILILGKTSKAASFADFGK